MGERKEQRKIIYGKEYSGENTTWYGADTKAEVSDQIIKEKEGEVEWH